MEEQQKPRVVGDEEGDRALLALGIQRLAIPIPFPQAGGPVNAYLIENEDGSLTLFDAGLGSEDAEEALLRGFAEAGRAPEQVSRIVLSHGHIDHYGAAALIAQRSGAPIFLHPRDHEKVLAAGRPPHKEAQLRAYLARQGVPRSDIEDMVEIDQAQRQLARGLEKVEPIDEGARLQFRRFEARVLHMPGHTPGLICVWAPEQRLIFSDDHLLSRVSPNPLIELGEQGEADKFRALEAYFASARRLHALELDWILPGHGKPFRGHREVLDSLFAFYERRQAKILAALEGGPRTAYELVLAVFGSAGTLQLFLMLSEIVGNLELLESRGAVARRPGEPVRYEARPLS